MYNPKKLTVPFAAVAFAVATVIGLPYLAVGRTGGEFTHEEYENWGTVTAMENCQVGKYSLRCSVQTDTVSIPHIDVTDFSPDRSTPLSIGDSIGMIKRSNSVREVVFYIKNGQETAQSTCFDWMPCFRK